MWYYLVDVMNIFKLNPDEYFGLIINLLLLFSLLGVCIPILIIIFLKAFQKLKPYSVKVRNRGLLNKIPIISLVLLVLTFFVRSFITAGLPAYYNWYDYELTLDKSSLPVGVEIVEMANPHPGYGIRNTSYEPLYLGYYESDEGWIYADIFPKFKIRNANRTTNFIMRFKLFGGEVYECDKKVSGDTVDCITRQSAGAMDQERKLLSLFGNSLIAVNGGVKGVRKGVPNPPDNNVPDPDPFVIRGYYKGKPWDINGSISYHLKGGYTGEF